MTLVSANLHNKSGSTLQYGPGWDLRFLGTINCD